ncbi:hypothetical protein [Acidiplasma cupricumulans]|uniref:Uncharacterized protein n=2 Tax=Acidiplasma cupricumulans TaxID=312540 RepID=A0A0Q0RVU0_9ARCH|nr:hypothetical protein [Acidiplasma cupricumulans]KQB36499.1 hypothetical protein AOG55_04000 [Acidiplasma cupricumulans]
MLEARSLKIGFSVALIIAGIYDLYLNKSYSFTGLILILSGFFLIIYERDEPRKTKDFIKANENYNKNDMDYNNVIKVSETKEKITIMPGDAKTTISIPVGLKKYLDDNKKDKETYGDEIIRLLNR